MFLDGTYSLTHSQTGKALGALLCLEEGKAMQGDAWFAQSPHNHHLAWRERAGLDSPLCFSPERGVQGLWWILPLALSMGLEVLFFTVVLSWGQPETLPGWHMLVGEERTEVLTKTGR